MPAPVHPSFAWLPLSDLDFEKGVENGPILPLPTDREDRVVDFEPCVVNPPAKGCFTEHHVIDHLHSFEIEHNQVVQQSPLRSVCRLFIPRAFLAAEQNQMVLGMIPNCQVTHSPEEGNLRQLFLIFFFFLDYGMVVEVSDVKFEDTNFEIVLRSHEPPSVKDITEG